MTTAKKLIFVVHEHHATHLHRDFRLQIGHILKSWAVPKEPPIEEGIKRLAILVDDHALSYAKFEGFIGEGYGKGEVKIWDFGMYEMESVHDNKFVFVLYGKKLKGRYTLLKFEKAKNGWLFFKTEEQPLKT
ncbi:MAG: DNA polymerase ligase N-terminal domain-containing protein [Candidatus Woesearchaeota archaeon]